MIIQMSIVIIEVENKKQLKKFITFARWLYCRNGFYTGALGWEEKLKFSPKCINACDCLCKQFVAKQGKKVAVFDADFFSPTVPEMFQLPQGVTRGTEGLYPALTEGGIKVMSIGPLLEDETDSITLQSAVMGQILQRLWTNVIWDELDCLLIDLPPGTADVYVAAFEQLPFDGVVIVSTPQNLVNQTVVRTVRLALEKHVPILGLIENFSGLFPGDSAEQLADRFEIPLLDRLAFDPVLSDSADEGRLESLGSAYLPKTVERIAAL